MKEWVKLSDRVPTEEKKYIVYCPSADPEKPWIAMAWFHPGDGSWSLIPRMWSAVISHWMELPEPPTDV